MVDVPKIVQRATITLIAVVGLISPSEVQADLTVTGNFGPYGDIGFATSPTNLGVTFGAATGMGSIYQMDAFVNVPGVDLGAGVGMSADLANGPPTGIGYTFAASQPTASQLILGYTFQNNTHGTLANFQFLQYVDADIGPNFADEYAVVNGTNKLGGINPTSFQVGDPSSSSIFTNLTNGTLNNANDFPSPTQSGDVSFATAFLLPSLASGQMITFYVMLSDDGSTLGNFSINQHDPVFTGDVLTASAIIPEPSTLVLVAIGSILTLGHRRFYAWTRSQ